MNEFCFKHTTKSGYFRNDVQLFRGVVLECRFDEQICDFIKTASNNIRPNYWETN